MSFLLKDEQRSAGEEHSDDDEESDEDDDKDDEGHDRDGQNHPKTQERWAETPDEDARERAANGKVQFWWEVALAIYTAHGPPTECKCKWHRRLR